jgi:RHS repeat-associated protein
MGNVTDKLQSTDQVQGFSHDSLNRLTSAYAEGGSGGTYASSSSPQLYTYDSQGRLDEKAGVSLAYTATPTGTCHTTSTYPNRNATIPHAVSSADTYDFTYDCSGNMITRETSAGTQTLIYDAENHLVEVKIGSTTLAEYTYDGDGARVMAVVYNGSDTITTRYYGNYLETIESYSNGITLLTSRKYYYAGTSRIAMRSAGGPAQYLLSDHLGSTSLVVSIKRGIATISAENRYMPWGEVRYSIGTMPTDYTYTGQKNAPEIGLMFYNARWYDPAIAHFTQADSLIPGAGSPQAWDRYAYVFNNPLKYTDPYGHDPWFIEGWDEIYLQSQTGNTCAVVSSAVALSILYDTRMTQTDVQPLFPLTYIGEGIGVWPQLQADTLNLLPGVEATYTQGERIDLIDNLENGLTTLVTIAFPKDPGIGHTLLIIGYDPDIDQLWLFDPAYGDALDESSISMRYEGKNSLNDIWSKENFIIKPYDMVTVRRNELPPLPIPKHGFIGRPVFISNEEFR